MKRRRRNINRSASGSSRADRTGSRRSPDLNLQARTPSDRKVDRTVLTVVLLLVAFGTVMVYSASSAVAAEPPINDHAFYLKRHLLRLIIGVAIMLVLARASYSKVIRLGRPLLGVSLLALILVLLPGVEGERAGGGVQRWLALGPLSFQPSEIARFALLLWLADTLVARRSALDRFQEGFLPVVLPVALVVALIMVEDFSTAVAVVAICGSMIMLAGVRYVHVGAVVAAAVPLMYLGMVSSEYRRARILTFLEGGSDIQGANYQVWQSLIGLGDGGLFGKGLGQSAQKLRFLPEPFNDFIFSIIGEELGFVGAMAVLILLFVLVMRGLRIARSVSTSTGALLAAGVSISIGVYALVNVGVVTSLLPATGLALPFISYGGSSMVISLAAVGLLLSVSRDADLESAPARGILP